MKQYRKKPVVIAAAQWWKNGDHPLDFPEHGRGGITEGSIVKRYSHHDDTGTIECAQCSGSMCYHGWIDTLEGGHIVCPGDWIITGIEGEMYPCKPGIFAATYDEVAE